MSTIRLQVNGQKRQLDADSDIPLLYALRDQLGLQGPKFGCGRGLKSGRISLSKRRSFHTSSGGTSPTNRLGMSRTPFVSMATATFEGISASSSASDCSRNCSCQED